MIWLAIAGSAIVLFGLIVLRGAPYVPSQKRYTRQALTELYPLSDKDVLVDVGSGDGIVLRLASERGARAIGFELNPLLVIISRWLSRRDTRVSVRLADFWLTLLPEETTVVYAFTASLYVKKLAGKLQQEATRLGRPLRFLLYGHSLPDHQPDAVLGAYHLYTFFPLQIDKA